MDFILSINIILLIFIIVSVSIIFIMKSNINDLSQKVKLIEKMLFDEFTRSRNENMLNHKDLREEVTKNINIFNLILISFPPFSYCFIFPLFLYSLLPLQLPLLLYNLTLLENL